MTLASGTNLQPGNSAVLFWRAESAAYPYSTLVAAVAPATAPAATFVPFCDIPEIVESQGAKNIWGIGSRQASADVAGLITYELNPNFVLADLALLAKLIGDGSGEFGTPDLQFFAGTYGANGYMDVYRYCKANTLTMNWQEGGELNVGANIWALTKQASTVRAPVLADVSPGLSPLTWYNFTTFMVKGLNYRDQIMGLNFGVNQNLERKVHGADTGDNDDRSRTAMALMPHNLDYTMEITLHSPQLAAALVNAAANSTSWPTTDTVPAIQVIVSNAGNTPAGFTAATLEIDFASARLAVKTQRGGKANDQMSSTVTALVRGVTTTAS